jgi:hypothetical protein
VRRGSLRARKREKLASGSRASAAQNAGQELLRIHNFSAEHQLQIRAIECRRKDFLRSAPKLSERSPD